MPVMKRHQLIIISYTNETVMTEPRLIDKSNFSATGLLLFACTFNSNVIQVAYLGLLSACGQC